jgi:putative flippase GtrA
VFRDSKFSLINDIYLSIAANSLVFAIGMGFIWSLVDQLKMNPYGAKLLANGATFVANFVIRAFFFRNK